MHHILKQTGIKHNIPMICHKQISFLGIYMLQSSVCEFFYASLQYLLCESKHYIALKFGNGRQVGNHQPGGFYIFIGIHI